EARRQLSRVKADVSRVNLTRERLNDDRQRVNKLEEKLAPLPEPRKPVKKAEVLEEKDTGPLHIGDTVRVLSFGQNAELIGLSADHSEAEVKMGSMRFRVSVENIERLSRRQAESQERAKQPAVTLPSYEDRPEVAMQLDIRGWRVEDALSELDTYLNDAVMAGLAAVRIVHGKGTGALRQAVREQLSRNPLVKSFASAPPKEGGDGVTVVKFSA
ncbi:MAG TPA: Smr/MutS family protein, partial [Ktedonobacteraceae bacterium]|nr:Smr/MutS family protein [Ktedonobacteraceae bacterium]